jgi:hypothetical protein
MYFYFKKQPPLLYIISDLLPCFFQENIENKYFPLPCSSGGVQLGTLSFPLVEEGRKRVKKPKSMDESRQINSKHMMKK